MSHFLVGTKPNGNIAISLNDFDDATAWERCCRIAAECPGVTWEISTDNPYSHSRPGK